MKRQHYAMLAFAAMLIFAMPIRRFIRAIADVSPPLPIDFRYADATTLMPRCCRHLFRRRHFAGCLFFRC